MGKDGIYSVWIAMRRYPWLPPVDYHDKGLTGANLMKPLSKVVVIEDGVTTVGDLKKLLAKYEFHGFPVIDNHREFVGYATRQELTTALGEKKNYYLLVTSSSITHCFVLFSSFFF
jgi:chloride channel 3/4/5